MKLLVRTFEAKPGLRSHFQSFNTSYRTLENWATNELQQWFLSNYLALIPTLPEEERAAAYIHNDHGLMTRAWEYSKAQWLAHAHKTGAGEWMDSPRGRGHAAGLAPDPEATRGSAGVLQVHRAVRSTQSLPRPVRLREDTSLAHRRPRESRDSSRWPLPRLPHGSPPRRSRRHSSPSPLGQDPEPRGPRT